MINLTNLWFKFKSLFRDWNRIEWGDEIIVDKEIPYHFVIDEDESWRGQCRKYEPTDEYAIAFNYDQFPTDCTANEAVLNSIYAELEELSHWGMNNREVDDDHSAVWKGTLVQLTAESVDRTVWDVVDGEEKKFEP